MKKMVPNFLVRTVSSPKFVSSILTFFILFSSVSPLIPVVGAQEREPEVEEVQEEVVVEESVVQESQPVLEEVIEEDLPEDPSASSGQEAEEEEVQGEILSTAIESAKIIFGNVQVGVDYRYHLNEAVSLKFSTLPEGDYYLSIEEVQTELGIGYEFLSDLENGTFTYDLRLPNPEQDTDVEVQFSEDGENFAEIDETMSVSDYEAVLFGLDHFTIFIITDDEATYTDPWIDYATQGYLDAGVHYPDTSVVAGSTATWTFSSTTAGTYRVYISWSTHANRTTAAPYTLNYDGGSFGFVINQELLADQATVGGSGEFSGWYYVGDYVLNSSSNLVLSSLTNAGSEYVIADEVLLAPAIDPIVDAQVTTDTTPTVTGTISQDDVPAATDLVINVDGTDYAATPNVNGDWAIVTNPLSDGTYDVVVSYTDMGGSTITDSTVDELVVDTTQPTVAITSPSNDAYVNNPFQVVGTATDATSGIQNMRIRFRDNGTNTLVATCWAVYDGSLNWTLNVNDGGACSVPDGYYRIVARARDNANNDKYDSVLRVTIDNVKPIISDHIYVLTSGGLYLIGAIAEDATSPIAEITYEIQDAGGAVLDAGNFFQLNGIDWNGNPQTGQFGIDKKVGGVAGTAVLSGDQHKLIICTTDLAGNTGGNLAGTGCLEINIDKQAPIVTPVDDIPLKEGDAFPSIPMNVSDGTGVLKFCVRYTHTPEIVGGAQMSPKKVCDTFQFAIAPLNKDYDLRDFLFEGLDFADTSVLYEGTYEVEYWAGDVVAQVRGWTDYFTLTVDNVTPIVDLKANGATSITINEGDSVNFAGLFDDPSYLPSSSAYGGLPNSPDDAKWSPVMDYGDGTVAYYPLGMDLPGAVPTIPSNTYSTSGTYTAILWICEDRPEFHMAGNASENVLLEKLLSPSAAEAVNGFNPLSEGTCGMSSVTINVNNLVPAVAIGANPGTSVTEGTAVTLTANGTGGNAPLSYSWSGACSGTAVTCTMPSTPGTYTAVVTVTDVDGDTATDTITITVNPAPVPLPTPEPIPQVLGTGNVPEEEDAEETDEEETEEEAEEVAEEDDGQVLGLDCEEESKVSGYVYYDKNGDDEKDEDEEGSEDVTIKVYAEIDGIRKLISSTRTDENGYWETKICPGEYEVEIDKDDLPSGAEVKGDDVLKITVDLDEETNDIDFLIEDDGLFAGLKWWYCVIPLLILLLLGGGYFVTRRRE